MGVNEIDGSGLAYAKARAGFLNKFALKKVLKV